MAISRSPSARPFSLRRSAFAVLAAAGVGLSTQVAVAPAASAAVVAPNPTAQVAVDTALGQLGDPYVWAGAGPDVFDCSGLTQYAYAAAGIELPHSSSMQSTIGTYVPPEALQPGDLIFFYSPVGHVGMYIGDGQMVHAPQPGETVEIIPVDYVSGYNTARRLA